MQARAIILLFTLILFSCSPYETPPIVEKDESEHELHAISELPEQEKDYLVIIAVGDNLYHNVMVRDGENGNYEAAYSEILSLVQNSDIAFINQESIPGGIEFGFSGFPLFNSPQALGRAIVNTGFNVINHANNHVMDMGERGVNAVLDFWDDIPGIKILGIHRTEDSRNNPVIMEINNIRVGFLAYTFGTNGIRIPPNRPYLVSITERQTMSREINALRQLCDFLVVSMHWGNEYQHNYNDNQRELSLFLAEHEVDLVLGHHPHVIQSVEFILRPDGRYMLCYYSLGNLISAQATPPTMLGAMAYVKIQRIPGRNGDEGDSFIFMDYGAIPLVTHFEGNWVNFRVYPLYQYTDEIAARHRFNRDGTVLNMDYLTALSERIFGHGNIMHDPFNPGKDF